jgi:hypothetical protein
MRSNFGVGPRHRPVVVGIDGMPRQRGGVGARLRRVGVTVLHAFRYPATGEAASELALVYDVEQVRDQETTVLAGFGDQFPEVRLSQ